MELGQAIRKIRREKGIKQKDLASKIGITNSYLSNIEAGNKMPSLEILEAISKCLNIPIAVLFISKMNEIENEIYKTQLLELAFSIIKKYV